MEIMKKVVGGDDLLDGGEIRLVAFEWAQQEQPHSFALHICLTAKGGQRRQFRGLMELRQFTCHKILMSAELRFVALLAVDTNPYADWVRVCRPWGYVDNCCSLRASLS